jgi:hypothetical protein
MILYMFLTVHHSVDLKFTTNLMHNFFIYSIIILYHDPLHVSDRAS